MNKWMNALSEHYKGIRRSYPDDKILILFDIDGTILDSRHMILYALKSYDICHGTVCFENLQVDDITVNETEVDLILEDLKIPEYVRQEILAWYDKRCWSTDAILNAHSSFTGVMEVIRWFQMQPNTYIGLNTGRPENIRTATLRSLNEIGKEYRVTFDNDLLYMNQCGWAEQIVEGKVAGIKAFQNKGYRVAAFIDNEPDNLKAVAAIDCNKEILLLHADTIFKSKRQNIPSHSVSGNHYDLVQLIDEKDLPKHIQFVWHGTHNKEALRQFIQTNITWAEFDVRLDMKGQKVIVREDSFEDFPLQEYEGFFYLAEILPFAMEAGKSVKLDLKESHRLLDNVIDLLHRCSVDDLNVWFSGKTEVLGSAGFQKLSKAFPRSIVQCPVDSLVPLILHAPQKALPILDTVRSWGVNRFSVSWKTPDILPLLDQLDQWGYEVNIYNIPDLEAFLKAVLYLPRSITSDFDFPQWNYFSLRGKEVSKSIDSARAFRWPEQYFLAGRKVIG